MLLAVALSFLSFAAVLSNTSFTASSDGEDSESSRDRSSHGSSGGTVTRVSQTSKVAPLMSDKRADVSKGNSTDSASTSTSTSTKHPHRSRRAEAVSRFKYLFLTVLSPRLALAACLLSLNTVLVHWINQSALQGQAKLHVDSSALVHSAIATLFTCWLPMWMFFFFHQSAGRFVAAFLMALALWGADQICQLGESYTFDGTAAAVGGSTAVDVVGTSALVIAVIACVLCLAMLVFNVFSLQLSAKVLARRQKEVNTQVSAMQAELDQCKAESARLKEQAAAARQQTELITYCRPVYREFSVWIAMASTPSSQAAPVAAAEGELALAAPSATGLSVTAAAGSVHPSALIVSQQRGSVTSAERSANNVTHLSTPKAAPVLPQSPTQGKWAGTRGFGTTIAIDVAPPAIPSSYNPFVLVANGFASPATMWPRKDDNAIVKLRLASIHHPSPPPSIALKQVELAVLLRHPVLLELLKDSAVASFTPESLMLCSDLQLFHRIVQLAVPSVVAVAARELYREYVVSGAAYEVNISATQRDELRSRIVGSNQVDGGVFKSTELEMIKLISTNQMGPFVASPLAQLAAAVLAAPESTASAPSGSISSPVMTVTPAAVNWDGSRGSNTNSTRTTIVKLEQQSTTPSARASTSHRSTLTPTQTNGVSSAWGRRAT